MKNKRIQQLEVGMPVLIKKEGSAFIAYTPALDVSTYGNTKNQAKKNFGELVEIFFEEFIDNPAALEVVLESLGWKKVQNNWKPPKIDNITQDVRVSLAV